GTGPGADLGVRRRWSGHGDDPGGAVSDTYLELVNSGFTKDLAKRLGLPRPARLRRTDPDSIDNPLIPGPAVALWHGADTAGRPRRSGHGDDPGGAVSVTYLELVNSGFTTDLAKRLGLPRPARLRRTDPDSIDNPLIPGPAVVLGHGADADDVGPVSQD